VTECARFSQTRVMGFRFRSRHGRRSSFPPWVPYAIGVVSFVAQLAIVGFRDCVYCVPTSLSLAFLANALFIRRP